MEISPVPKLAHEFAGSAEPFRPAGHHPSGHGACKHCGLEAWSRRSDQECPARLRAHLDTLWGLVNTPQTTDFLEAVKTEAAHQQLAWSAEHDARKTPADWFWLVGYLAGKALHLPEKRLHHIVTTAAALLNWHRSERG